MVKAIRLMKIKEILNERGVVDIPTLSALTGVSKVTIRSDLITLENEGFLYRTYGGATLQRTSVPKTEPTSAYSPDSERLQKMTELGSIVERHVAPNSWVLLGYGNTCREISHSLLNSNIKVVTGNIDAAVILSESRNIDIFIPGGYLHKHYDYLMLNGEWYQKALVGLNINQAYISVAGVDFAGFSVGDVLECQTLELIRKISQEVIVVADSTKFGKTAFFRLSGLEYADTIITNDDIPEEYRELIQSSGIRLLTTPSQK